jgi:hypothetical protein
MFWQIIDQFVTSILSLIGFIFNFLSVIVFSLIIKNDQRDDMYKHLLLKSICEMAGCFFNVFNFINYDKALYCSYIMSIYNIWFQKYIIKALFVASIGFEIAATFNCAISIEKKMKWCEKKLSFWLWVVSVFVLSFGVEMFPIFTFYITESNYIDKYNRTIHEYSIYFTDLSSKLKMFYLTESIIKDVILLLILLLLNIYILFKLIQIGIRKRRLTSNNQNSNRAENRKIIMIIVLFLTFLLGHLPSFVYFAFGNSYPSIYWIKFLYYGSVTLYSSYSTSFFVYFCFNNIFRRSFLKIIHFRSILINSR